MKLLSILSAGAIFALPFTLTAQVRHSSDEISVMRCSDLETLSIHTSYLLQQTDMNYVSPTGDLFIVEVYDHNQNLASLRACSYYYFNAATGAKVKSEDTNSHRSFVSTEQGILAVGRDITVLDSTTLQPLWYHKRFRDIPFFVHHGTLMALGGGRGRFYGYDLATGAELWEVKIEHDGGVSEVFVLDDDHVLLVADELVKINTKTGAMQKFEIKNSIKNGGQITGQIFAGIALGVAGVASAATTGVGYYYVPPTHGNIGQSNGTLYQIMGESNTIAHLTSNVLQSGPFLYLADRDGVRCFNPDLDLIWSANLPPRHASQSHLSLSGDTLWMVNFGLGQFDGSRTSHTGYPFVAAFRAKTGEQLFYKEIGEKHAPVRQVNVKGQRACYLYRDSCQVAHLDGSREVFTQRGKEFKDLTIADGEIYLLNAETRRFEPLSPTETYLTNQEGNLFRLSSTEGLVQESTSGYVYHRCGIFADSLNVMLGGPNHTDCWLTNPSGDAMYHVMTPINDYIVRKDYLYLFYDDKFFILNREKLGLATEAEEQ